MTIGSQEVCTFVHELCVHASANLRDSQFEQEIITFERSPIAHLNMMWNYVLSTTKTSTLVASGPSVFSTSACTPWPETVTPIME